MLPAISKLPGVLGWSILPCGPDKRPIIGSWKSFQTKHPTEQEISAWQRFGARENLPTPAFQN
jgi:hypothetical protein